MTDFLQLRGLKPISVKVEDDIYVVEAAGGWVPTACPECKVGRLYGHGTQLQTFRDTPSHGKTVRINVQRRRYQCQACRKTLFDPIPDLDSKRLATRRLIQHIRKYCLRETFASVARQVDMDEKTIRHVFDDYVAELASTSRFQTPRYLGIDELKIIGAYRAMITNVERNTIFDLRESRSKADLLAYFQVLPDKDKVEWVAMDMYHVYRQVVRQALPHARIVVDRFHIERMANNVLEKMRKRFRKTLPERQRLRLKDERRLLLKRQQDLTPEGMAKMLAWFRQFPLLGEAHAIKEGFMAIWDLRDRCSAEVALDTWHGNIGSELQADFKDILTATTNWREEILAYFENPITNGYTESLNGITKGMNRMGRGYSFEVIRARMLYEGKALKDAIMVVEEPVKDDHSIGFFRRATESLPRQRTVRRAVLYGPSMATLAKLLEEGHFE
ncbi:MAG: ISL3 family transposase [Proteobacteria bacterium]|nr:ISL3 family transposase [Pseudomonadota bacterium]